MPWLLTITGRTTGQTWKRQSSVFSFRTPRTTSQSLMRRYTGKCTQVISSSMEVSRLKHWVSERVSLWVFVPSYVYKCVCQQHSELLYNDLTSKITSHLQQISTNLQVSGSSYAVYRATRENAEQAKWLRVWTRGPELLFQSVFSPCLCSLRVLWLPQHSQKLSNTPLAS